LYCTNLITKYTTVNYLKWFLISQTLRCMVLVASAITPEHELALAPTSGPEVKLAVSVGHVIIWIALSAFTRTGF